MGLSEAEQQFVDIVQQSQYLSAAVLLAFLWTVESVVPMYVGRKRRMSHNAANLALACWGLLSLTGNRATAEMSFMPRDSHAAVLLSADDRTTAGLHVWSKWVNRRSVYEPSSVVLRSMGTV